MLWILLLGLPSNSLAFDDWSKRDYALEATWIAIHTVDWGLTLDIAKNPDKYHEMNPIIGRHPSVGKVNSYMFASTIIHPVFVHILPSKWRPYFQAFTIGISSACVINNFNIGLHINF